MNPRGILIIEDSLIVQRIYERVLQPYREKGTRLFQAATGRDALRQIRLNGEIDLILTDTTLPDIQGIQLVREIKREARMDKVPVLVISTEDDEENVRKGYEAGATAFLPKPFRVDELHSWIRKACAPRGGGGEADVTPRAVL